MKKYVLILAAAVALAACTKTEVVPVNSDADVEITFLTAPLTKSLADGQSTFSTNNVFQSAAFYDTAAYDYDGNAETFIAPTTVKYFTSVWKAADANGNAVSYYWPKDGGKLSFFSWSLNKTTLTYADGSKPSVAINNKNGVVLTGYDVTKNEDFMVADPALDQTKNTSPAKYVTEGVPTLFKHKLAQIVFKAKTNADYTVAPYKQKFTITGIYFEKVATTATYTQNVPATTGQDAITDQWSVSTSNQVNYLVNGSAEVKSGDAVAVTSDAVNLYVPQSYTAADQKLIVKYKVSRASDSGTLSSEYTEEVSLQALLGKTECGKKYTITLNFGLDEILWDPAIEDWTDGTSSSYDVK
jgi:hypothetical protein